MLLWLPCGVVALARCSPCPALPCRGSLLCKPAGFVPSALLQANDTASHFRSASAGGFYPQITKKNQLFP